MPDLLHMLESLVQSVMDKNRLLSRKALQLCPVASGQRLALNISICVLVHRKCREQMNTRQHKYRKWYQTLSGCGLRPSVFYTLNIGLTCSRWVALVNGAWTWLTASIRALAVFAICSISTLYRSRLCFSLATPVSNSSAEGHLSDLRAVSGSE